jgi:hypothetical protein
MMMDESPQPIPIPEIAFTSVLEELMGSLFLDNSMSRESAQVAERSLTDWVNKSSMTLMAVGTDLLLSTPKVVKGLAFLEDKFQDPDFMAALCVDGDLFNTTYRNVLASLKFRAEYISYVFEKVTVNPAQVQSDVQKHFHVHVVSSASQVEGFPKELLQDDLERRKAIQMFNAYHEVVSLKTGTSKIPLPKKRAPRVFTPTEDLKRLPPPPLTPEEMAD